MSKLKNFTVILLLTSIGGLAACAPNAKLTEFPPCQGQACTQTAQRIDWPKPAEMGVFPVAVENYAFNLPSMPENAIIHWGEDVTFACEDGSAFTFNLETHDSLTPELSAPESSNYSVADSAELTFTKTIHDTPPNDPNDLWIWNQALFLKTEAFKNGTQIFTASKGSLTMYVWETKSSITGDTMSAYIFDANSRKSYARIFAKHTSFQNFKSVIAGVELK